MKMKNSKTPMPKKKGKEKNGAVRKAHIPFRLNFLFLIIFVLFVTLIVQLANVQIVKKDYYADKAEASQKKTVSTSTPRGLIYDSQKTLLVGNSSQQAIKYTKSSGMTAAEILKVANKINSLIDVPADTLTERDRKDYYLADTKRYKAVIASIPESKLVDKHGDEITTTAQYALAVKYVKNSQIQYDAKTLKAVSIFKKINGAYALEPVTIKNKDVSNNDIAIIGENSASLPGISTGLDWNRSYPAGESLQSIIGTVSSESAGLPAEDLQKYLKLGYARNDRVGQTYLEKQYESELKGTKATSKVTIGKNNKITSQKTTSKGSQGNSLVLTINQEFQTKVDSILRTNYQNLMNAGVAKYSQGAYVVVNNVKTGDVIALSGVSKDVGGTTLSNDALGTFTKAFIPGSIVKPATITAGYQNNVISGNQVLTDEPIQIKGSATKSSWYNPSGPAIQITAEEALRRSSNAYMMQIAFRLINTTYSSGMSMPSNLTGFTKLRDVYAKFGLGTATGVDLPGESTGYIGTDFKNKDGSLKDGVMGNYLDLSYGNYDSYTPLQLAQYVATIANNGKRMAPRIVKSIYKTNSDGTLGTKVKDVESKVENQVSLTTEQLNILHEGMHQVVYNGGTGSALASSKYNVGAKTGTAEVVYVDPTTKAQTALENSTVIAYAPYDDPEISISVVLPFIGDDKSSTNQVIARQVLDAYYDLANK